MSESRHVLYLNGLERSKVGLPEKLLYSYLKLRKVRLVYGLVDWHSNRPFQELFDEAYSKAEQLLGQYGKLSIVGASAGGSLGVNIFQSLRAHNQEDDIYSVNLSAWLRVSDIERLEYAALHRPGKQPSKAFMDSVIRCDAAAVPELTDADKARMITIQPRADEIVPLNVMVIEGVEAQSVPISGHVAGIALAAVCLPHYL